MSAPELDETQAADGDRAALVYATDDDAAGERVRAIIRRGGWDAVKIGGVDATKSIEVFGDLHTSGDQLDGVPSAHQVLQRLDQSVTVSDAQQLADALAAKPAEIVVDGTIKGIGSITLPEGTTLRGGRLVFTAKGVRLTRDNTLRDIAIETSDYEVAVYNDTSIEYAGVLRLDNVETIGQVLILAEEKLVRGRVDIDGVFVKEADVRGRSEQPHGYGVDVLQGGLTLWNRQADSSSVLEGHLRNVSVGTEETPVRGSGVFVAGHADREGRSDGGKFYADMLHVTDVVIDGGIVPNTPDKITGGVFVVSGAEVDRVEVTGTTVTKGANDMVHDLWGEVKEWIVTGPVTSTGPSGIGFVNFGKMGELRIDAPITTHGVGARGFNLYDGSIESATFSSITTHGDGAIGIQVSKPMGPLVVTGDVKTTGGEGMSLVKGVQTLLRATAISLKPGADLTRLSVSGVVSTQGDGLTTVEVLDGAHVGELDLSGGVEAHGKDSVTLDRHSAQ